ncbi:MAG: glycosyltransferase family 2 protein [Bacteroidia bacterium]|nr:glycosyltransferase family 2 protein [Bacteroidia bacterium]
MSPSVYIVVLAYGGQDWLEVCLPSLLRTDYPACTIWVVDNASEPPLLPWIKYRFPSVRSLRYERNEGYAGGYQRFFSEYGHEVPYIAFLNGDVEVTPNWLTPLVELLERCPRVGAVQPKILSWRDREAFEYAGAAGGLMDAWGYPTCRGRGEKDFGQYNKPARIFWAGGAAFLLRTKAVLRDLNGLLFKPYYFMHMEEIDLCWRLHRAGWEIAYEPQSVVYHVGGAALAQEHPRKTYYNFRNSLYMLWENLPSSERIWRVLWRLILDAPAALYFLFRGKLPHVLAVLKAHWDFYRYLLRGGTSFSDSLPKPPYRSLSGVLDKSQFFYRTPYPTYPLSCFSP